MTKFGGLGGVMDGAIYNPDDLFERAVKEALGEWLVESDEHAVLMWTALANRVWEHKADGHTASYSFRAAGDLVAAVRGVGENYCKWAWRTPDAHTEGYVDPHIAQALARLGWTPVHDMELD